MLRGIYEKRFSSTASYTVLRVIYEKRSEEKLIIETGGPNPSLEESRSPFVDHLYDPRDRRRPIMSDEIVDIRDNDVRKNNSACNVQRDEARVCLCISFSMIRVCLFVTLAACPSACPSLFFFLFF